ncbi:MAG: 50S ribosomal protein L25 [Planctomycetia bacterium]|nr:50S ribosomal protein L25 [Planctomycetia bacterium]
MSDVLNVKKRETQGKKATRRLRATGVVPAVLYGHKEANVTLSVSSTELTPVLKHGGKLVELRGEVTEKALIRELQWDVYGKHVLHVDFARVSEHEKVHVTVPVELRGDAVGVKNGGIVEQPIHEVHIECPASAIPEKIVVRIADLQLNTSLTIGDIVPPDQVKILDDADLVVVTCHTPIDSADEAGGAGSVEPEIIGRAAKEEGDDEK